MFNVGRYTSSLCEDRLTSSATPLSAQHRRENDYGIRHRHEGTNIPSTNPFFKLISIICFGAPTTHWGHITVSAKRAKLHGDIHIWPTYVQTLVKDWTTFNLAVSSIFFLLRWRLNIANYLFGGRRLSCSRA